MFKKKTIKHVHFLHGHFKNSNTVGMGDDRFVWWWVGGGGNGFVCGGGGGSRSAVVFADLPLNVRQFGTEIFTPFLLNFIVWRLQWIESNSNNYILITE